MESFKVELQPEIRQEPDCYCKEDDLLGDGLIQPRFVSRVAPDSQLLGRIVNEEPTCPAGYQWVCEDRNIYQFEKLEEPNQIKELAGLKPFTLGVGTTYQGPSQRNIPKREIKQQKQIAFPEA